MATKIGIFGGSFNPPHKGHVEICRYLLSQNAVDQIWVVPCYKHPFDKELAPFEERVTMCKLAFGEFFGKIKISDIERTLGGVSYTVKTLEHLRESHPGNEFHLIVGSDAAKESTTWKEASKLSELAKLLEVPRGTNSPIPDISSTDVRKAVRSNKNISGLVTKEVAEYIISRKLYI